MPNCARPWFSRSLLALTAPLLVASIVPSGIHAQQPALYRDSLKPLDARVEDLLARMTLEEKVAQMEGLSPGRSLDSLLAGGDTTHYGPAGRRLGFGAITGLGFGGPARGGPRARAELANRVQHYFVERTRLGIPVIIVDEALHGLAAQGATNYPTPPALSSTFDVKLVHQLFSEIGLEAGSVGTDLVLAPVLDLAQDPRWGRAEETYGEDPYLNSRMGVAAITGFQGDTPPFIDRQHVAATTKHFAGHGVPEGGRNIGPVHVSEHELRDLHLRPFEAAVHEAGVMAVMPAYHEVLGVPVHASPFMLTEILRNEWGFEGITVSDFFGVRYNLDTHRVARDTATAARLAANAGVDIDMPRLESYQYLVAEVRAGRLNEAVVDRAVRHVLRAKFAMRLFDRPYVDAASAERIVASAEHLATARRAGAEAITLLKNEGGLLPLDPAKVRRIAIIGPHANFAERGNYSGMPSSSVTPVAALRERLGNGAQVLYAEGVRLIDPNSRGGSGGAAGPVGGGGVRLTDDSINARLIRAAIDTANKADVVVLALGTTARMMHEAWRGNDGDNDDLELRGMQNELADAIRATGKPVVVLLFSGGPLTFAHIDRTMPIILYCWYLGQEAGHAVSDVLFGDVSPGGHLPVTIPRSVGQLPAYYNHAPSARRSNYLFDESSPLYSFGYGLSYTTFRTDSVRVERDSIGVADSVHVLARVTNTGARSGDAVVQLYIRQDFTIPTRPVKELKDFARVPLAAGESKTVRLTLTPAKLGHFGIDQRFVVEPGPFTVMVGSSSRDQDLTTVSLMVR
jgi:beta-glucosidase